MKQYRNPQKALAWQRNRRDANRRLVWEYKKTHPCVDCGESDPVVLEFDHQRDKKNWIANMLGSNVSHKKILDEIAKCVVRCANCHRRKTAKQLGYKMSKLSGLISREEKRENL